MTIVGRLHETLIFKQRVGRLAHLLSADLPDGEVLDVGCGDGFLDALIQQERPDVHIEGIDVLIRPQTHILVKKFDGRNLPFDEKAFETVMFVDVLHHTRDPLTLLKDAARVARRYILIKDHTLDGVLARSTLRLMDWVGNRHHRVALPYNYWPTVRWRRAFDEIDLTVDRWHPRLDLYPWPSSLLFDRSLHFIARLRSGDS
jgi:SAM-dependent methyltransferase